MPTRIGAAAAAALCQGTRFRVIESSGPLLADGFHRFESAGRLCPTLGIAMILPVMFAAFDGALEVVLHLGAATQYAAWWDAAAPRAA